MSSLLNLDGAIESPADTIRKFLSGKWAAANLGFGCMFTSEGGIDVGGSTVTPTVPASLQLPSKDGTNTITLTWRDKGTARNAWQIFIRTGGAALVESQGTRATPRFRLTIPSDYTMQQFDDLISASTDMTDLLIISAVGGTGDPATTQPERGTYQFAGGAEDVVNRELELTVTDLSLIERKADVSVMVHAGDKRELDGSRDITYNEQTIYVDVGAANGSNTRQDRITQVADFIEDAVFNNARGPFTKSADGLNSGILSLGSRSVYWVRTPETESEGKTESLHGEIMVRTQRVRTSE